MGEDRQDYSNSATNIDAGMKDALDIEYVRCPCCGKTTLKKPVRPGDDLMDQWLASTATGVPFTHVYRLYGGKVHITAVQPDATTGARVAGAISAVDRAKDTVEFNALTESDMLALVNTVRLFSCVKEIVFTSPVQKRFDTGAADDQAIDELHKALLLQRAGAPVADWSEHLVTAYHILTDKANISTLPANVVLAVGQTHAQLSDILMSAGFDTDFWQGIELA